jgi:Ca2+/Na+ antiporter
MFFVTALRNFECGSRVPHLPISRDRRISLLVEVMLMTWTWTPFLLGLAVVWGVFTVALVILLIYRSTLTMHEEEQLYLDEANSHMQQEQTELLVKVSRLTKPVWVCGASSGVLLLVLLGMFIYQGLNAVQ